MNKGIYFRPFKKDDLLAVKPVEPVAESREFGPEMLQAIEDSDLSVTGVKDGKPIICGGIHPVSEDQGELWLRVGECCLNFRISTFRSIREGLKVIEETYPFKQLNATVAASFKTGARLMKFLGFHLVQTVTHDGEKWLIFSKLVKT